MRDYIRKSFKLISILLLLAHCSEDNALKCLPSEEENVQFTRLHFTGNNVDSLGNWNHWEVCEHFILDFERTPLDVYEVSFSESIECSCLFINEVNPAYCEVSYEVEPGIFSIDTYHWDILFVFDGETIFHPPCGYMEFPAAYRTAGEVYGEIDFVITGTIGGNGYGFWFTDLDRDNQTLIYKGIGGFQAEGQANGAAYTRNADRVFGELGGFIITIFRIT